MLWPTNNQGFLQASSTLPCLALSAAAIVHRGRGDAQPFAAAPRGPSQLPPGLAWTCCRHRKPHPSGPALPQDRPEWGLRDLSWDDHTCEAGSLHTSVSVSARRGAVAWGAGSAGRARAPSSCSPMRYGAADATRPPARNPCTPTRPAPRVRLRIHASTHPRIHAITHSRIHESMDPRIHLQAMCGPTQRPPRRTPSSATCPGCESLPSMLPA